MVVVHGDEDAETGNGEADWDERERETVFEFVAEEGDDHGEGEGGRPGWDTVELCADGRVAVRLYDARGEKGVPVSRHDEPEIHESADEDLVVFEHLDDVPDADGAFSRSGGRAALILAQPVLNVNALVFGEPFCVFGEIGDDEEEDDGDHGGQDALENEDPTPPLVAAHVVHFPYSGGEEPAECAGEGGAAEEERVPFLGFAAFVPHPDEVEGAGEHAGLSETEQKAGGEEAGVVLHEALADSDDAEEEHAC